MLANNSMTTLIRTLVITKLDQCNLWLPLYTCRTDCSPCWMPPLGLSTRAGRQNTQPHCYGSFTGCTSRNESSSGFVFWRTIVCMTQHRRTCLTACGRHQISSLVDVSALMTPRHYKCVDSSSYPRRQRLSVSGGCSACMEQSATRDSGLLLTFDIPEGDQVSPFSSVIRYGWRGAVYSDSQQTSALCCATVKSRFL